MVEGRGAKVEVVERKGGKEPLGKRLETGYGSQSTWTSSRRARLVGPEPVDGTQDRKEGREGVNDIFLSEERPRQEEKNRK